MESSEFRCGCPETFGDGSALTALAKNRFVYVVETNLSKHSRDDVAGWAKEAIVRWSDQDIDIAGERIEHLSDAKPDDIVLRIISADLGDDGVIADQDLPQRGKRSYTQRWNVRVNFVPTDRQMRSGTIDPLRSGAHEFGHLWGSHHWPMEDPDELMEPQITQHIISPQPTEVALVRKWFGRRPVQPGPDPTPTPVIREWSIKGENFELSAGGSIVIKRNGILQRVEKSPFSGKK